MTEKRFKHIENAVGIQCISYDNKDVSMGTFADINGIEQIIDLLNNLSDENEQLKKNNKRLAREISSTNIVLDILQEENEQLKKTMQSERRELISKNIEYRNRVYDLEKENEQLKSEIKDYQDVLARMEERLLNGDVE